MLTLPPVQTPVSYPVVEVLLRHFGPELLPYAYQIANCESRLRQFDDVGNVLKGKVNPKDRGIFQINIDYHSETAKKMGLDVHTLEGNVAYARYLYTVFAWRPWMASFSCWRPELGV